MFPLEKGCGEKREPYRRSIQGRHEIHCLFLLENALEVWIAYSYRTATKVDSTLILIMIHL